MTHTTLAAIIAETAQKHGVTFADIIGPRRHRPLSRARQECYWRAINESGLSATRIGMVMQKDHSSVIHGAQRWAAMGAMTERCRRLRAFAGAL